MLSIYLPNDQKHYSPGSWLEIVVLLVLQRPIFDALSLRLRLEGCERTEWTLVDERRVAESLTVRDERPICDLTLTLWGYLSRKVRARNALNSHSNVDRKAEKEDRCDGESGYTNFGSSDLNEASVREPSMTSFSVDRLLLDRLLLAEGYHVFPFRLQLPLVQSLPSTFEHKCGTVSYELRASIEFEQRKSVELTHPMTLQTYCTLTSDPSLLNRSNYPNARSTAAAAVVADASSQ